MDDGHLGKCKDCACEDVRNNRAKNVKRYNKFDRDRYRKNISRIWAVKYDSMRRRVLGLTDHSKLIGKDLLSEAEFLSWCEIEKNNFMKFYEKWKKSGYQRKFAPSIDRINNNLGYVLGNLQWLTQSENSKKYNKKYASAEI